MEEVQKISNIAEKIGADEIVFSCMDPEYDHGAMVSY